VGMVAVVVVITATVILVCVHGYVEGVLCWIFLRVTMAAMSKRVFRGLVSDGKSYGIEVLKWLDNFRYTEQKRRCPGRWGRLRGT
jgi:hypothetical protein